MTYKKKNEEKKAQFFGIFLDFLFVFVFFILLICNSTVDQILEWRLNFRQEAGNMLRCDAQTCYGDPYEALSICFVICNGLLVRAAPTWAAGRRLPVLEEIFQYNTSSFL